MKSCTTGVRPRVRLRRRAAAAALLFVLAGCGVGVVGTGSGKIDDGTKGIAFEPAEVCTAPFAGTGLACPTDATNRGGEGSAPVAWTGPAGSLARVEGSLLALELPCTGVSFRGHWGRLDDGTLAFVGSAVDPRQSAPQAGLAYVLPVPEQPDAVGWLELADAGGRRLEGPFLMRRADGRVDAAACPG